MSLWPIHNIESILSLTLTHTIAQTITHSLVLTPNTHCLSLVSKSVSPALRDNPFVQLFVRFLRVISLYCCHVSLQYDAYAMIYFSCYSLSSIFRSIYGFNKGSDSRLYPKLSSGQLVSHGMEISNSSSELNITRGNPI